MHAYRPAAAGQYRLSLPRAERRHPWLARLFDLYALVDASVAEALAASGRESGCRAGCHGCCHQLIPVTPLEVAGLGWFMREEAALDVRAALRGKMGGEGNATVVSCRFLLGGSCAAYAVRPVACRRYMVLGKRCASGEDASRTRPGDVLSPSREALNAAYALTLPYYAALGETVPEGAGAFAFMKQRTISLAAVSAALIEPFANGNE